MSAKRFLVLYSHFSTDAFTNHLSGFSPDIEVSVRSR